MSYLVDWKYIAPFPETSCIATFIVDCKEYKLTVDSPDTAEQINNMLKANYNAGKTQATRVMKRDVIRFAETLGDQEKM